MMLIFELSPLFPDKIQPLFNLCDLCYKCYKGQTAGTLTYKMLQIISNIFVSLFI